MENLSKSNETCPLKSTCKVSLVGKCDNCFTAWSHIKYLFEEPSDPQQKRLYTLAKSRMKMKGLDERLANLICRQPIVGDAILYLVVNDLVLNQHDVLTKEAVLCFEWMFPPKNKALFDGVCVAKFSVTNGARLKQVFFKEGLKWLDGATCCTVCSKCNNYLFVAKGTKNTVVCLECGLNLDINGASLGTVVSRYMSYVMLELLKQSLESEVYKKFASLRRIV